MFSGRVKQGRAPSAVGFFGGLIFVGIGLFVVIPTFGAFGVAWTAIAAVIVAYHGYALLSRRGASVYEVEVDGGEGRSVTERLADIENARSRGLMTEAEYQAQRQRIISGA